jgi:hypothetical protein
VGMVKGTYVQCTKTGKLGVVERTPGTSDGQYTHVEWLISWDVKDGAVHPHHYLEYVCIEELKELPINETHMGLHALRWRILR